MESDSMNECERGLINNEASLLRSADGMTTVYLVGSRLGHGRAARRLQLLEGRSSTQGNQKMIRQ